MQQAGTISEFEFPKAFLAELGVTPGTKHQSTFGKKEKNLEDAMKLMRDLEERKKELERQAELDRELFFDKDKWVFMRSYFHNGFKWTLLPERAEDGAEVGAGGVGTRIDLDVEIKLSDHNRQFLPPRGA